MIHFAGPVLDESVGVEMHKLDVTNVFDLYFDACCLFWDFSYR